MGYKNPDPCADLSPVGDVRIVPSILDDGAGGAAVLVPAAAVDRDGDAVAGQQLDLHRCWCIVFQNGQDGSLAAAAAAVRW